MVHKRTVSLRDKRRQGTIDGFVDAALDLMVEDGFEALTLAKVAERVEYAVGAIYRYFDSKDELTIAVQQRVLDHLRTDLAAALVEVDAHIARARTLAPKQIALLRLLCVPLVHERLALERPAYFAMLSLNLATPKVLVPSDSAQPAFVALMAVNLAIAALFEEAAAAGALAPGPAPRRAVVLWAAHQGILQLRKLARFGVASLLAENLSLEAIRPLFIGWGADPAEIDALYTRARKLLPARPAQP